MQLFLHSLLLAFNLSQNFIMRLGFIGTGKIASSVITGICTSKISFKKILVSPRNKNTAQKLKKKFKKVNIAKTNQEIVDKCNWVFWL